MSINDSLVNSLLQIVSIENALKFFLVYFFIVWIAILVWIVKDITNRTENIFFQIFCISLVLFLTPFLWFFIYLIIRPSKTLFETYYDEVDHNLEFLQSQIKSKYKIVEKMSCPSCKAEITEDFKYCPVCGHKLFLDKKLKNTKVN